MKGQLVEHRKIWGEKNSLDNLKMRADFFHGMTYILPSILPILGNKNDVMSAANTIPSALNFVCSKEVCSFPRYIMRFIMIHLEKLWSQVEDDTFFSRGWNFKETWSRFFPQKSECQTNGSVRCHLKPSEF